LEKRKAHYPLATVKRLIAEGRVSFTMTAASSISSSPSWKIC